MAVLQRQCTGRVNSRPMFIRNIYCINHTILAELQLQNLICLFSVYRPGSVIVEFMLYYDKGTTKEEMENLVRNAVKSGKLANYSVERESLRFAGN